MRDIENGFGYVFVNRSLACTPSEANRTVVSSKARGSASSPVTQGRPGAARRAAADAPNTDQQFEEEELWEPK